MPCKLRFLASSLALFFAAIATHSTAQEVSLSDCQEWQNQIDYYSALRKKGGSVQQMEFWKQARREYEEKFDKNGCRKYGREVR